MYAVNCSFIIIQSVSVARYCSSHERKQVLQCYQHSPVVPAAQYIDNWHSLCLCRLWISKTYMCVWKCEDVCPLRGTWVTERFIPSACLSKRCCGQGHLHWQWMVCGRGSGIKGLLTRTESGSFSLWQREVTGRQHTGDRQTASQRHLHSFRTAAYPCTKNTPSWNALHIHSHTLSYTQMHVHTREYVDTYAAHRYTKPWFQNWPLLEFTLSM